MSDDAPLAPAIDDRPALDRLDARARVLGAVTVVLALLAIHSVPVLAAALAVCALAALVSGHTPLALARRLIHLEGFLVVLVLLLPLTVPGPAVVALGPLALSAPGLDRAIVVLLRVNAAAIVIFTLLAGLEPVRFGHALARLGLPTKLVHLLLFTTRWVSLVGEEARRLHDALKVRAFRPTTSRHGFRTLAQFTGQLLVRAFERAERVEEAMRCRAFAGRFALVDESRFGRYDALLAAGLGLGLALLLLADRLA